MIPAKNRQMILTHLHLTEWSGESDRGGPMEVEDPELGLQECDNKPGLRWDSKSELGPNEDELSDMVEISNEGLELHFTFKIDY
jgi:hypothetical protein